jgi:hypothetical protein
VTDGLDGTATAAFVRMHIGISGDHGISPSPLAGGGWGERTNIRKLALLAPFPPGPTRKGRGSVFDRLLLVPAIATPAGSPV